MARTRATKATKAAPTKSEPAPSTSKHTLPAASSNPPKILILPNTATSDARVVSLINPRYSKPTRYLICPETGAYEFLKIAAPKTTPRSWLIEDATTTTTTTSDEPSSTAQDDAAPFQAQVTKGADLYLATPIDPLFLVLPALAAQFTAPTKRMFLASDDHLETISSDAPHLRDLVVRWPTWRKVLESRMAAVCDTVQGPGEDENLFRFSEDKLLREVLAKARRISEGAGLPRSLEDKFVSKALEAPVLGVKRSGAPIAAVAVPKSEPSSASEAESQESQSSVATTATSASEASTAATSVVMDDDESGEAAEPRETMSAAITASAAVTALQRLRVAFSFICSSYVPPGMAAVLKRMLAENKPDVADFAPLEEYVARLGKLRQEALLSRSASDYSRKRGANDEENEERAEKKRKKEEEDKRKKAGESLGVKRLKKVNTAGMQKLSAFFKPKAS